MRYMFRLTAICLLLLLTTAPAHADIVEWEDTLTWDPGLYFSACLQSETYTHDITADNVGEEVFVVGRDTVTGYGLSIGLYDDPGRDGSEWAWINLPGLFSDRVVEIDYENVEIGFSLKGLASLNATGTLDVTITRLWGDFYLGSSTLVASGQTPFAVPIPGTFLLLFPGMAGLIACRTAFGVSDLWFVVSG